MQCPLQHAAWLNLLTPQPSSHLSQRSTPYPHPHPLPAPHRYNLFFGFNGCSQQMFSLSINGTAEVLDMQVCPLGTHEADWERVSVLACKADGAVKQVRCCALGASVRALLRSGGFSEGVAALWGFQ